MISSTAQVACLVAGSLQALGPAAPMAQTWNQYWVPLVRPVTVQLEALPAILIMSRNSPSCESVLEPKATEATQSHRKAIY